MTYNEPCGLNDKIELLKEVSLESFRRTAYARVVKNVSIYDITNCSSAREAQREL